MLRLFTRNTSSRLLLCSSRSIAMKSENEEDKTNAVLDRIKRELAEDKKKLQWRKKPNMWTSRLRAFGDMEQTSDYLVAMQQPIDFSPKGIKSWWLRRKEHIERAMQAYIPQRVEMLGPDLAAAHFILFRRGAVRFQHSPGWMRANEDQEFDLPKKFDQRYKVEGLRCDDMLLYYEGLENIRNLQYLKFLSFRNVALFDDWCLDRVSGNQYPNLEVLDISGTSCTYNGLSCLYRLPSLKLLIVEDVTKSVEFSLSCAMLEESLPTLKIVNADTVHNL